MKRYNAESRDADEVDATEESVVDFSQQGKATLIADETEVEIQEVDEKAGEVAIDEEGEGQGEEEAGRRFAWPSREQIFNWAPFWGVILLGAIGLVANGMISLIEGRLLRWRTP